MHSRLLIALPLSATLALAGCMNSYDQNSKATQGAVIGGVAGLVAGLTAKNESVGKTVVLAGIGAAIGGAIGQGLEQQANALQNDLGNSDVNIVNTGSELIVTLPQDILFATDSAIVVQSLQDDLRRVAANLQDYPNTTVQIIGHTDNTGSASYNQELSSRRASAVAAILTANGVSYNRVQAIGRGEDAPVTTNLTAEGRAQNRRVEIIITPNA